MTKANDLASLLDANGDVVSSALDNVPASDLVNDTTPQLGGNLDLNSNNITGTGNIDVTGTVTADSVGVGAAPNATFGSLLYTQGTPAVNKPIVSAYSQGNSNNAGFALFNDSGNRGIWTTGSTMRFTRTYEGNSTADVTIDASGNLLVGTTNTDPAFNNVTGQSMASTGQLQVTRDGGTAALFNRKTSDGEIVSFRKDGGTVGSIAATTRGGATDIFIGSGDTGIYFTQALDAIAPSNQGSDRDAAIDLGRSASRFKDLYLSGGVYLGGTGSANYLQDYEEGTFNVVLGGSSGTSGQTYTNQTGRYTKIGSLVHCSGYITLSAIGTVTGTYARLQNLPFTVGSAAPYQNGNYSGGVFSYWQGFGVNSAGFTLYPDTGATFAYVMYRGSFGNSSQYMSPSGWGGSPALMFGLTYTTDS